MSAFDNVELNISSSLTLTITGNEFTNSLLKLDDCLTVEISDNLFNDVVGATCKFMVSLTLLENIVSIKDSSNVASDLLLISGNKFNRCETSLSAVNIEDISQVQVLQETHTSAKSSVLMVSGADDLTITTLKVTSMDIKTKPIRKIFLLTF